MGASYQIISLHSGMLYLGGKFNCIVYFIQSNLNGKVILQKQKLYYFILPHLFEEGKNHIFGYAHSFKIL